MARWVKIPAATPSNLTTTRTHIAQEKNWLPKMILRFPYIMWHVPINNKYKLKKKKEGETSLRTEWYMESKILN